MKSASFIGLICFFHMILQMWWKQNPKHKKDDLSLTHMALVTMVPVPMTIFMEVFSVPLATQSPLCFPFQFQSTDSFNLITCLSV